MGPDLDIPRRRHIAEAVSAAGEGGPDAGGSDTLMRLAGAAAQSHPDWVIRVALGRANAIMGGGRSANRRVALRAERRVIENPGSDVEAEPIEIIRFGRPHHGDVGIGG